MSISVIYKTNKKTCLWRPRFLVFGLLFFGSQIRSPGQEVEAYAKPREDYVYVYTFEHEYETTLFRSEKFTPILETEEGYIILLELAGKPKLVLLPFYSRDRQVAEEKYRGVGVTYTAYLDFNQGHLPFSSNEYYEVVKREKGKLFIDYRLKGFNKIVEVPESKFLVKSGFEYHLEETLTDIRKSYRDYQTNELHPNNWRGSTVNSNSITKIESPTHIGRIKKEIVAFNDMQTATLPASDLDGILNEVWVDQKRLIIAPIVYTHESEEALHYFVNMRGHDRPVLIKAFETPLDSEGYSKIVRVTSSTGINNRFLEITESTNIIFHPISRFLSEGELVAIRSGYSSHYMYAPGGEFEISDESVTLMTPRGFLQQWERETKYNGLIPGDTLYESLLKFDVPVASSSEREWNALKQLKHLAAINKSITPSEDASVHDLLTSLTRLETEASRLGLSLNQNPQRALFPAQNESYFHYWKFTFNNVNGQAAKERNKDVLTKQMLRAKLLISESTFQDLTDFLSAQIYTYSNFLPAPLNRINQLAVEPPVSASMLMVFDFPVAQSFKLNPETLEVLTFDKVSLASRNTIVDSGTEQNWMLDTTATKVWQTAIVTKLQEVHDPEYWLAIQKKEAEEKARQLELAKQRVFASQIPEVEETGVLNNSKAPWMATGAWLILLLITNTGFFAMAKATPVRHS